MSSLRIDPVSAYILFTHDNLSCSEVCLAEINIATQTSFFLVFACFHSSLNSAVRSSLKISTLIFLQNYMAFCLGKQMHGTYFFLQVPVSPNFRDVFCPAAWILWYAQEKSLICSLSLFLVVVGWKQCSFQPYTSLRWNWKSCARFLTWA